MLPLILMKEILVSHSNEHLSAMRAAPKNFQLNKCSGVYQSKHGIQLSKYYLVKLDYFPTNWTPFSHLKLRSHKFAVNIFIFLQIVLLVRPVYNMTSAKEI